MEIKLCEMAYSNPSLEEFRLKQFTLFYLLLKFSFDLAAVVKSHSLSVFNSSMTSFKVTSFNSKSNLCFLFEPVRL